ncbi:hypothetical protein ACVWU4_001033 [Campylobacter coli]
MVNENNVYEEDIQNEEEYLEDSEYLNETSDVPDECIEDVPEDNIEDEEYPEDEDFEEELADEIFLESSTLQDIPSLCSQGFNDEADAIAFQHGVAICIMCEGTGLQEGDDYCSCNNCNGKGYIEKED